MFGQGLSFSTCWFWDSMANSVFFGGTIKFFRIHTRCHLEQQQKITHRPINSQALISIFNGGRQGEEMTTHWSWQLRMFRSKFDPQYICLLKDYFFWGEWVIRIFKDWLGLKVSIRDFCGSKLWGFCAPSHCADDDAAAVARESNFVSMPGLISTMRYPNWKLHKVYESTWSKHSQMIHLIWVNTVWRWWGWILEKLPSHSFMSTFDVFSSSFTTPVRGPGSLSKRTCRYLKSQAGIQHSIEICTKTHLPKFQVSHFPTTCPYVFLKHDMFLTNKGVHNHTACHDVAMGIPGSCSGTSCSICAFLAAPGGAFFWWFLDDPMMCTKSTVCLY